MAANSAFIVNGLWKQCVYKRWTITAVSLSSCRKCITTTCLPWSCCSVYAFSLCCDRASAFIQISRRTQDGRSVGRSVSRSVDRSRIRSYEGQTVTSERWTDSNAIQCLLPPSAEDKLLEASGHHATSGRREKTYLT
jgi:hypothetical protein